ncbi:type II toxin-antitoxin system RelE/ParE family toxin [Yeosuana sp.]|uniref:type II toxin-antitoxin system RelE/ParE family toxin n=1 Tax=Yeosuana sp. TaxID=2529388 RepID=UPI004054C4CC
MDFTFKNKELEKLYTTGKSKKLKLPKDIIEKFFARVQQIEAANDIYDLWNDKGLNFEKLINTENSYSMRLKIKYRLEMDIDWKNNELTIGDFIITNISNHYS